MKFTRNWKLLVMLATVWVVITAANYYSRHDGIYETNGTWSSASHAGSSSGSNPGCTVAGSNKIYIADTITTNCATIDWKGNNEFYIEEGGVLIVNGDFKLRGSSSIQMHPNAIINVNGDFELSGNGSFDLQGNVAVSGDMSVSGSGHIDLTGNLEITHDLNVSGSGDIQLEGTMYVANNVTVSGSGSVCGSGSAEVGGGISGSGWCYTVSTLPVQLLSFRAQLDQNGNIKLKWATETETQNDFFILERSGNGLSFSEIAHIDGAGNSQRKKDYEYVDESIFSGTYYYKLTQVDYNGEYETFEIIAVTVKNDDDFESCELVVMPNPCVGSCKARLLNCPSGQYTTSLLDGYGNIIEELVPIYSDTKQIEYHISKTNYTMPGVYVLRAARENNQLTKKVMIK